MSKSIKLEVLHAYTVDPNIDVFDEVFSHCPKGQDISR